MFGLKPKYKVYTALLSQEGGQPPTAIVLENTIGNLEWVYRSDGYYSLQSTDFPFTENKTFITPFFPKSDIIS